jgi:hypothetical protein
MIGKSLATIIVLFLGIYAFWADALGGGHFLNPSGIAFLVLAACVWFGWEPITAAFKSVRDESNIPIIRLGSAIIRGMRRLPQSPRKSSGEA